MNEGRCRIVQRHLRFNGGMAYGIDCLLTPPSLGGRCDTQMTFDFPVSHDISDGSHSRGVFDGPTTSDHLLLLLLLLW